MLPMYTDTSFNKMSVTQVSIPVTITKLLKNQANQFWVIHLQDVLYIITMIDAL